jgi:hypothetical protein
VNNGARRGLRFLSRVGHPKDESSEADIVRTARFATSLWRTINGDVASISEAESLKGTRAIDGVCAYDAHLRCTLLALWQWIWPNHCFAVLRVQAWKGAENTPRYKELGAHFVMKITDEEKEAAQAEEAGFASFNKVVDSEIDRQKWRGEMAIRAYEYQRADKGSSMMKDIGELGIGEALPPVQKDLGFKLGGWLASTTQQRRAAGLDGGTAVTKIRLLVGKSSGE